MKADTCRCVGPRISYSTRRLQGRRKPSREAYDATAVVEVANNSLKVTWTPPMTVPDTPPEVNDGGSRDNRIQDFVGFSGHGTDW